MNKELIIIPARKGSKRLPKKNILNLAGKPLIKYTFDFLSKNFERNNINIVVTSDDKKILELASTYSFQQIDRDPYLALDHSTTVDVSLDALIKMEEKFGYKYDIIHLFQPTSPLRKISDFRKIRNLMNTNLEIESVFSVTKEVSFHPAYLYQKKAGTNKPISLFSNKFPIGIRGQDIPPVFRRDGSYYSVRSNTFKLTKKFVPYYDKCEMIYIDPKNSINIDTQIDFDFAEFLINKYKKNENYT